MGSRYDAPGTGAAAPEASDADPSGALQPGPLEVPDGVGTRQVPPPRIDWPATQVEPEAPWPTVTANTPQPGPQCVGHGRHARLRDRGRRHCSWTRPAWLVFWVGCRPAGGFLVVFLILAQRWACRVRSPALTPGRDAPRHPPAPCPASRPPRCRPDAPAAPARWPGVTIGRCDSPLAAPARPTARARVLHLCPTAALGSCPGCGGLRPSTTCSTSGPPRPATCLFVVSCCRSLACGACAGPRALDPDMRSPPRRRWCAVGIVGSSSCCSPLCPVPWPANTPAGGSAGALRTNWAARQRQPLTFPNDAPDRGGPGVVVRAQ